MQATTHLMR